MVDQNDPSDRQKTVVQSSDCQTQCLENSVVPVFAVLDLPLAQVPTVQVMIALCNQLDL